MIDLRVYHKDMIAFYELMGWDISHEFRRVPALEATRRMEFLKEETSELQIARDLADVIDALVDIGYIAIGNLMHCGHAINHIEPGLASNHEFKMRGVLYDQVGCRPLRSMEVMRAMASNSLDELVRPLLNNMNISLQQDPVKAAAMSCAILIRVADIAQYIGLNFWDHWKEVHNANMRKVCASADNPSSRGYTDGDAVKPDGWVGPDHDAIIDNRREKNFD